MYAYAQVYACLDIAHITRMLGRYLSNSGLDHREAAKWAMRYLKRTKNYMLTYRRLDQLKIIGYIDSDFFFYAKIVCYEASNHRTLL